jgi:hypothetical protein
MIIDQKLYYKKLPMDSELYNNAEYVDTKTHKLMYEQQKEPEDQVESTGEDKKEKGE